MSVIGDKYKGLNIIGVDEERDDYISNPWEPAEQKAECCEEIPDADPCTDMGKTETWAGYSAGESGSWNADQIFAKWKKQLGDKLIDYEIISTGGPINGPCGEKKTTWEGTVGCCDYPLPMYWNDSDFPKSVAIDQTYTINVSGGTVPISYSVLGYGVTITASTDNLVRFKTDICMCKPVLLVATDSCGVQIVKLLSVDDGEWDSVADETMWSDYGWWQSGKPSAGSSSGVYAYGFNSDRTKYSVQGYGMLLANDFADIEALTGQPSYSSTALVIPQNYDGYTAIEGTTIFWQDISGDPENSHDYRAFFAETTTQETKEYTPGECDEELVYDDDASAEIIADNSSCYVYWDGGVAPFDVSLEGVNVYLDVDKTTNQLRTNADHAQIFSGDACGGIYVRIIDSCGRSTEGVVRSTTGEWAYLGLAFTNDSQYRDNFDDLFSQGVAYSTQWNSTVSAWEMNGLYACCPDDEPSPTPPDSEVLIIGVNGFVCSCEARERWKFDPYTGQLQWLYTNDSDTYIAYLTESICGGVNGYKVQRYFPSSGGFKYWEWEC
jgi:hypothetical protein